jgi:asparagine synthase (glutamine-hydrolysing)
LAHRKKQMFTVPIGDWFKGESYPWLSDLLQKNGLIQATFDMEQVRSMLQAHKGNERNLTRELRALAALALWSEALP